MNELIPIVGAALLLHACSKPIALAEPPVEMRQISVWIYSPAAPNNVVKKFQATGMSVGAVFKEIGPLAPSWDVTIRCDGGYNKQPPLYSQSMTLASAQKKLEIMQGLDDSTSVHELCMKGMAAHLKMLTETASDELKYYR